MDVLTHVTIIILSCGALWLGADWLVDSAARIARKFGISDLVIGLTVVAFGTSAPEFAVTIGSAMKGSSDIALANVIGSNIFNIGFILGGVAVITVVQTGKSLVWRDGMVLLATMALLWVMMLDGNVSRIDGVILFVLLGAYLLFLFWKKEPAVEEEISHAPATWRDGPMFLLGLGLIFGGQHFMVDSAVILAAKFGISQFVIGMTIVAAGTSVPEFAVSMIAIIKKHHGISAGNLIGSNIFNTLGVLGLAGALHPMSLNAAALTSVAAQFVLTLIVVLFMRTGYRLVRTEGIILLLISFLIWAWNFKTGIAT